MTPSQTPLVCNIRALTTEQRARHRALAQDLFADRSRVQELSDGYALRLPLETDWAQRVAEFMTLEHRCCPFLQLGLSLEPNANDMQLRLTGTPEAKALLSAELNL
jgi:hypothetical protein